MGRTRRVNREAWKKCSNCAVEQCPDMLQMKVCDQWSQIKKLWERYYQKIDISEFDQRKLELLKQGKRMQL